MFKTNYYDRTKNYHKQKKYLKENLKREPTKEELESSGVGEIDVLKNLQIDKEQELNLRMRLTVFNDNLVKARKDLNLYQKEVCRTTGISISHYSQYETCKRYPTDEHKKLLADALKKSERYLFPEWLQMFSENWKRADREKLVTLKTEQLSSPEVLSLASPIDMQEQVSKSLLKDSVGKMLGKLQPRERKIVEMLFGLGKEHPHTLEEVGKEFDVTRERIRQISAHAVEKLQSRSGEDYYKLMDLAEDNGFISPEKKQEMINWHNAEVI